MVEQQCGNAVFERYMEALARYGAALSFVFLVVTAAGGNTGWAVFFFLATTGLLSGALWLEDTRWWGDVGSPGRGD